MKIDSKNIRLIIWIVFVVFSIFMISPNPYPKGIVVTSIQNDSPFAGKISNGDIIYSINDREVTLNNINEEYSGFLKLATNSGNKFSTVNGSLGLSARAPHTTNLKFGLDLEGGVRALVKLNDSFVVDQSISTLETRTNVYGLRESSFRPVVYKDGSFIEVSMSGGSAEELKELLERQGKFEAKIPFTIPLKNGKATLQLKKPYEIELKDGRLFIDGNSFDGETVLEGIHFSAGLTSGSVNLTSTVYGGKDIVNVFVDPKRSRIENLGNFYRWDFSVQISSESAEKFASVLKNVQRRIGTNYLESPINLYLDGELIDSLSISSNLKGQTVTEISISGSSPTLEEARNNQLTLQSILRSGSLPTEIEVVSLDSLSPTLGDEFVRSSLLAGFFAIVAITIVVFLRYRNVVATVAMVVVSLSEVLIILGMSVFIGWTIDLASIAGIIAAVGTGVDSQIIIMDQANRRNKSETMREKLRRALFIIVGAGGVIIAAMFPLMIFGFGLLRGFAITTMVGVLAGIFIARPAFGVIVEKLMKESLD
jgi:protein-export membrane protein SecD